jgi:hypothetical protein
MSGFVLGSWFLRCGLFDEFVGNGEQRRRHGEAEH